MNLREKIKQQLDRDIGYSGGTLLTYEQKEKLIDQLVEKAGENEQLTREEWKKKLAEEVDKKLKLILEKNLEKDDEVNVDLESQIQGLEKEAYLSACQNGYKGSQEDWEAQYSGSLREMMGLPKAEGEKNLKKDDK